MYTFLIWGWGIWKKGDLNLLVRLDVLVLWTRTLQTVQTCFSTNMQVHDNNSRYYCHDNDDVGWKKRSLFIVEHFASKIIESNMWEKNMWFHISVNVLKACKAQLKGRSSFESEKFDETHGLKVTMLGAVHLHSSSDLLTSCVDLISFTNLVSCVHGTVTIECLRLSSQWLLNGSDWSVDFSLLCTETLRWPEMTDTVKRLVIQSKWCHCEEQKSCTRWQSGVMQRVL